MISEKIMGVYAAVGKLAAKEQADWYRRVEREWGIGTFEMPLMAGAPPAPELVEAFAAIPASLVVTLVAQWAVTGQTNPVYGLASLDEGARQTAILDAYSVLQQCAMLAQEGVEIRNVVVQVSSRAGGAIPHAIAFYRSLVDLRKKVASNLPGTTLAVEVTDHLPVDHPIPFPSAKKAALTLADLIEVVATVNRENLPGHPIPLVVNWGRLLVNGDNPLTEINQILESVAPLAGVILSGAGASPEGFRDAHNSHLDPDSGFGMSDAEACASVLKESSQSIFLGMKCSRAKGSGEVSVEEVLQAQAALMGQVA